ncbi:hypothetical protein Dda_1652 [Drechslerella dactyloides]|uniref:BTB domain-containing protein n=1 Tax=Drechslerella dactyloides TaxID=74499 RepID=A0AAD6NNA0_DREDA|nr:hypothetical protein Dda_1652 [Drechslerella dactyloides]
MASENALKRFAQLFETDIFTCKIGTEKTYFVHKDALGSASGVLKKQMESCMKEGLTKCITLEDTADDGCAFGLFVQFCYLGEYYYEQRLNGALTVHASVYVLAEKIEALELKALALKKATSLCKTSQGITAVDRESAQALRLSLPETVPVIYNGTYDNNTGKLPTSPAPESMAGNTEAPSVVRDGFRMLIAKFAATCIHELRNIEEFMSVLEDFPAFASDILLFAYPAPNAIMDGTGSRKRPRDTGAY